MLHAAAVWFAELVFWVPQFLYHTFVVRSERALVSVHVA